MAYNSLRSIRERKGLTIAQLAGKTSISIRTLQSYELGERAIAADDLRKLSRVLFVPPAEILQRPAAAPLPEPAPRSFTPRPSPPEPLPRSIAVVAPEEPAPLASELSPRRSLVSPPREARRPPTDGTHPPRPRPPRPAREPRAPRPPGPATAGQLEQIRNLARRMALEEDELTERIGSSLEALDQRTARAAIATLRKEMEESGTWQPRVGEGPDQEGDYLAKLRERRVAVDVLLITGERLSGVVADFTPYLIRLRDPDAGTEVSVRKLAIAYYRTREPVDDAE